MQLASQGGAGSGNAMKMINADPVMALQYAAYKAARKKSAAAGPSPAESHP
jgi:acetyl-CoA carboxylase alpha subunit